MTRLGMENRMLSVTPKRLKTNCTGFFYELVATLTRVDAINVNRAGVWMCGLAIWRFSDFNTVVVY